MKMHFLKITCESYSKKYDIHQTPFELLTIIFNRENIRVGLINHGKRLLAKNCNYLIPLFSWKGDAKKRWLIFEVIARHKCYHIASSACPDNSVEMQMNWMRPLTFILNWFKVYGRDLIAFLTILNIRRQISKKAKHEPQWLVENNQFMYTCSWLL